MFIKRLLIITVVLSLYGCQSARTAMAIASTQTPFPTVSLSTPTEVKSSQEWILWSAGAHASPNELADGQQISCTVCHEPDGAGVSARPVWWNQESAQYETVANNTALCGQCHSETETSNHQNGVNNPIHSGLECTDCHNPHSTAASCSDSNCHQSIKQERAIPPSTPTGGQHPNSAAFCGGSGCHPSATQVALSSHSIHGSTHLMVSCAACHDASGLKFGPFGETGIWVTFRTREIDGIVTAIPFESHNLQISVKCTRCHFKGNPWGLPEVNGDEFK